MRTLCFVVIFAIVSCGSPKKNVTESETKTEKESTSTSNSEVTELAAVLKNPKNVSSVKSLITNSGLNWKTLILDKENSKIAVIEVPNDKTDFWIQRLSNSEEFSEVIKNSKNNVKALIERENSTLISLRKTKCFGDCPTYDLYIDKKGNVSFNGKEYVLQKGIQKFTLSEEQLNTIQKILNKQKFSSYKDVYDNPRIMDLPSTYITHDGKQVQIRLWNDDVPETLMELNEYIEGILIDKKFFE